MKITFIQSYYINIWEALGLGYIIAYLKKYYMGDLEINFYQRKFDDFNTVVQGSIDSDIVAFSCTSPAFNDALQIATAIKGINPKVHTVFGGWHPTALPKDVIKYKCVDQVVVGEGEWAMAQIVTGLREPIVYGRQMNVDQLPYPDRKAIKNHRAVALCESMNGKRTASFQLNRGCKVHCKFCSEIQMTGRYNKRKNPIRTRSFHDLLDEIEIVTEEYNLDYFKFVDATFDKDAETVREFCNLKAARDDMTYWEANIHPAFLQDEEVFEYMIHCNCDTINVGVESGSPAILQDIGKGTKVEHIKNIFKWAKKHKIKTRGYFLIGMPNETSYDHELTERLIDEIKPDVVGFTILCPYPGSDFFVRREHLKVDWSKADEYFNDFWKTKFYSNEQLKEVQAKFENKYSSIMCERRKK